MKTILERFFTGILILTFSLAILGYLLVRGAIRNLDNDISYFMLITGIGLILLFGFVLLLYLWNIRKKERIEIRKAEIIPSFWKKVTIELDSITIKSNSWTEKQTIETTIYDLEFDHNKTQTILEIETEINERKHVFHVPVKQNPQTLEMYFAIQKTTSLYINPENPEEFYLDLRFIPQ